MSRNQQSHAQSNEQIQQLHNSASPIHSSLHFLTSNNPQSSSEDEPQSLAPQESSSHQEYKAYKKIRKIRIGENPLNQYIASNQSEMSDQIYSSYELNKSKGRHQSSNQELNTLMKTDPKHLQPVPQCLRLTNFLKISISKPLQTPKSIFPLNPQQLYLINHMLPLSLSLQPDHPANKQTTPQNKQTTLNHYVSKQGKTTQTNRKQRVSPFMQTGNTSHSYQIIMQILTALNSSEQVHPFFKHTLQQFVGMYPEEGGYYKHYLGIVRRHGSLVELFAAVHRGQVKDFIDFQAEFLQMLTGSYIYHTFKKDQRMLGQTSVLQTAFYKLRKQLFHPWVDEYDQDERIKCKLLKVPKTTTIDIKSQMVEQGKQQSKQIGNRKCESNIFQRAQSNIFQRAQSNIPSKCELNILQLADSHNKHRILVMNHFLQCLQRNNPSRNCSLSCRITHLLSQYPHSHILVGQARSHLQLTPRVMQLQLFYRLRELVAAEIRQVDRTSDEGYRKMYYPRDDSEEFQVADESSSQQQDKDWK